MKAKKITKVHARKVLRELISIINQAKIDPCGESIRDIVTALRGPDSTRYDVKRMTTAVIRYKIGINSNSGVLCNSFDSLDDVKTFLNEPDISEASHFTHHIRRAVAALEYLNIKPPKERKMQVRSYE